MLEYFLGYEHIVKIQYDEGAQEPYKGHISDAGLDLYCNADVGIPPGVTVEIPSGVRVDPGCHIWLEIKARSSTMKKKGLEVIDAIIDAGYRGQMFAIVHNPTGGHKFVKKGERIIQIVPHRVIPIKFKEGKLSDSSRGSSGFGSTGV